MWYKYLCFDLNNVYRSKKLVRYYFECEKTKLNDCCEKDSSYLCWIFSVGPAYFLTENRYFWINHGNLARWWWRSSKISSSTGAFHACHLMILSWTRITFEFFFFFATLVMKEKLTDNLLTLFVTFIRFYKIENIVM